MSFSFQPFPADTHQELQKFFGKAAREVVKEKDKFWLLAEKHLRYFFLKIKKISDANTRQKTTVTRDMLTVFMTSSLISKSTLGDAKG